MKERSYLTTKAGEWQRPTKKNYRFACCDCGLVHLMEFKHIKWGRGRKIIFRAWRDITETDRLRKREKFARR